MNMAKLEFIFKIMVSVPVYVRARSRFDKPQLNFGKLSFITT